MIAGAINLNETKNTRRQKNIKLQKILGFRPAHGILIKMLKYTHRFGNPLGTGEAQVIHWAQVRHK